jgi:hypothetical protein
MSNISTRLVPHLIPANKDGFTTEQLKRNFESINRLSADFTAKQIQHIGSTAIEVQTLGVAGETRLQEIPFSAGLMGKNGIIQFSAFGRTNGTVNSPTLYVKFHRGTLPGNQMTSYSPGPTLHFWYITGYLASINSVTLQHSAVYLDADALTVPIISPSGFTENTDLNTAGNETAKSFYISITGQAPGDSSVASTFLSLSFIPGLS